MADILTHLRDNYVQLMPHKLLKPEGIVKESIVFVFSVVKELLEFFDIIGTSYTHNKNINIAYIIIQITVKFSLAIREWNRMSAIYKTWVRFKQFFSNSHHELRQTMDITVQDVVMHHVNMGHGGMTELQEVLLQEPVLVESPAIIQKQQVSHVVDDVQYNKQ